MKKMNFVLNITMAAVLALTLTAGCEKKEKDGGTDGKTPVTTAVDDPVWIKVNGNEITKSSIQGEIDAITKQLESQMIPPEQMESAMVRVKHDAMLMSVQMAILDMEVTKLGLKPDPVKVEEELQNIKRNMPDGQFQTILDEMGFTEDKVREDIGKQFTYQEYLEKAVVVEPPPDELIEQVYEGSKAQMSEPAKAVTKNIVLTVNPSMDEETKQKKKEQAETIRKRIVNGEDFDAVAKEVSEVPARNEDGNEIFTKGQMPGEFDDVVFNLKPDELSKVFETPIGYHIVKLVEIIPEGPKSLEEVRDQIIEFLENETRKKSMQEHINTLVNNAEVEYIEPLPSLQDDMMKKMMESMPPPEDTTEPEETIPDMDGSDSKPTMHEGNTHD